MSTKQEEHRKTEERKSEQKTKEVGLLEAVVRDNVMSDLGQPPALHRVQVKCVWGHSYRVNVFIGSDTTSFKVAHSYFLTADENGKILASSPAIQRAYS